MNDRVSTAMTGAERLEIVTMPLTARQMAQSGLTGQVASGKQE